MASTKLSFAKVATVGSTGLEIGRIYFETSTGLIKVAKSATEVDAFGGVREAKWDKDTQHLVITNANGNKIDLDLSDVASATEVTSAIAGKLNIGSDSDTSATVSYHGLKNYTDEAKAAAINTSKAYTDQKIGEIPAAIVYKGDETTITQSGSSTVTFSVGTIAQDKVNGLTTALAGKAPSSHTHTSAQITDLQDKLDAKANKSHTHAIADLTNLNEGWDALLIAAPDVAKNTELTALKGRVNTAETKLSGIEAGAQVNVIEGVQVNGVDLVPSGKKVNVTIPAATVTGVKANDKIISLDKTQLSSTLTMDYDSKNKLISLKGIGGAVISTIDATDFIKDGMVDSVSFDSKSKKLTITFNTVAGKDAIEVDLTSLVNTYTAGNGISISDNSIAINTAVVATKTDVNAVDSKLGNGFSSASTVTSQLAAVKATADAAKGAADKAQSTANSAASSASNANSELSKLKSDGSISPVEKTALKQQLSDINAEYAQITTDADKYGVSKTAYTTAYNAVKAALTKYSAVSPEYINIDSDYANISAYYTARQTILNAIVAAAKDLSTNAAESAENAKILAEAASGKMVYDDPGFAEGNNNVRVYNNSGDNTVTLTRKQIAGIPNSSGYGLEIQVKSEGAISPGLGGFTFNYYGKHKHEYVCSFLANIPKGRTVEFLTNPLGDGGVHKWITPHIGTGDWCRYAYYVQYGTGSIAGTFFFYLSSGDRPVTWQIAYATVFDLSGNSQDAAKNAQAAADAAQTSSQVNAAITTAIGKLDKTDTAVLNQFVTAVSETNGIVAVTRKALEINDIPSIPVSKITGLSGNVIVVGGEGTHADSMIDATVEDLYKKVASAAPLSHKQAYIDSELSDYTANENTMGCSPAAVKKAIGLFAISKNMSAEATTLEAGNQATVSYNKDTNKLTIGVPKGPAGPAGVSENFTITFANGTSEGVTKYTYNGGASKTLNINGTDGIAISGTTGNVNISGANFLPKSYFGSWKIQVDEEHSMIYIGDSGLELSRNNSVAIRKDPSTKIPHEMCILGETFATMSWVRSQLTLSEIQRLWGSNTLDVPSGTLNAKKVNAKEGFFETSDARLKDFTNNITSLETISSIPTKYFTWKSDENKIQHIGTSAQEIQKLYPDLVSENENGELSVDYSRLSIIAIAAIKELKKEIEELKSKRN